MPTAFSGRRTRQRIARAYHAFTDQAGFARVADLGQIAANGHSLSIPLYVKRGRNGSGAQADRPEDTRTLTEAWEDWERDGHAFWQRMDALVDTLDDLIYDKDSPNR